MTTIGFANIAQSPQDDIVSSIMPFLPQDVRVVERGVLDGLTRIQIDELSPEEGQPGIASGLNDGDSVLLSHALIIPLMQKIVDKLVEEDAADLVVILCGADWSDIRSRKLVVNPGRLFPSIVTALSWGSTLGVIKPSSSQIAKEKKRYEDLGISAFTTSASPFIGDDRLEAARKAAEEVKNAGCDIIWMSCVAMDLEMKAIVEEVTEKPVLLANEVLALNISALVGRGV
jgi:protein AroM